MSPRYPGPECCYSATSSGSDNRKPGGLGSRDDALIVRDHALEVGAELTGGGHVDGVDGARRPATSKVEADGRTSDIPSSSSSMTSGLTPSRAAARCASVVSNWDDQQGRWPMNHSRMAGEPSSATASSRNAEVSR